MCQLKESIKEIFLKEIPREELEEIGTDIDEHETFTTAGTPSTLWRVQSASEVGGINTVESSNVDTFETYRRILSLRCSN